MDDELRSKIIEAMQRLADIDYETEDEGDQLVAFIRENVLDPYVIDYLMIDHNELTPEQVLDKAMAYSPILLPDLTRE